MIPSDDSKGQITELLARWRQGDSAALNQMMPLVYDELRRLASRQMGRERAGHTLQTTALIHEAYLKLARQKRVEFQDRTHFMAVASRCIRQVLINYAHRKKTDKRGGDQVRVTLSSATPVSDAGQHLLELEEALTQLEDLNERKARVAEMRLLGGMSISDMARALEISEATVKRDWRFARAFLWNSLQDGAAP